MGHHFRYEPLDFTKDQFRLLTIQSGLTDLIRCTLTVNPFASDHICLSYRWNPEGGTKIIKVNGAEFVVNQNVFDFLLMARDIFPGKRLWIDAICISQSDITEKNHQVPYMGKIYSHASEVVVWLWPALDPIKHAISTMHQGTLPLMLVPHRIGEPWYLGKWAAIPLTLSAAKAAAYGDSPDRSISAQKARKAARALWTNGSSAILDVRLAMEELESFFTNPYWARAWIVQEILLNDHVRIVSGNASIPWKGVVEYATVWHSVNNQWEYGIVHNNFDIVDAWPFRTIAFNAHGRYFIDLIHIFSNQKCQDFHDNVYALRALSKDADRIMIDYGQSEEDFILKLLPAIYNDHSRNCFFDGLIGPFANLQVLDNLKQKSTLPQPDKYGKWSLDWHSHKYTFDASVSAYMVFPPKMSHVYPTGSPCGVANIISLDWLSYLEKSDIGRSDKHEVTNHFRSFFERWEQRGTIIRLHNHTYFLFTRVTEHLMKCKELVIPYVLDQPTAWKCHAKFSNSQPSGIIARQVNQFVAYDDNPLWQIEFTRGAAMRFFVVAECKERHHCKADQCVGFYFATDGSHVDQS